MQLLFEAVSENQPGPKWQALFDKNWPDYKAWFLSKRSPADGISVTVSEKKLRQFMPELLPTYERLVELAGGGDLAARVLSFYRPPAYLISCSQAVWSGPEGACLVRNYDLDPGLNEGVILHSRWNGRRVIATNECLWGVADGINEDGLALSLAFGGRRVVGDGFGIPVILRYILEFCETVAEAAEVLRRVPCHMAYNVTVLDRYGDHATVFVAPDRPTKVTRKPVATNHQGSIEWPEQARFSRTVERERLLNERLADKQIDEAEFIASFLCPPIFSHNYRNGFGTLYTAVYRPDRGVAEFRWLDGDWIQSFERFEEGRRLVRYTQNENAAGAGESAQPWADPAWSSADFGLTGIFRQTVHTVLERLDKAGMPMPVQWVDECMDEFSRTGQLPWHKLGAAWTRGMPPTPPGDSAAGLGEGPSRSP